MVSIGQGPFSERLGGDAICYGQKWAGDISMAEIMNCIIYHATTTSQEVAKSFKVTLSAL